MKFYNFSGGPSSLPELSLHAIYTHLLNYNDTGLCILELNHRSDTFKELLSETQNLVLELLNLTEDYIVIFLQGGASLQFTMLPMNYLKDGERADYVLTDPWSEKAAECAKFFGVPNIAFSSKHTNFNRLPEQIELKFVPSSRYVHITTNNTLSGTQWSYVPETWVIPLVGDASSDIMSRELDYSKFSLIYASAQKNLE